MWFVLLFHLMVLVVRACMRSIDNAITPFQHVVLTGGLVAPQSQSLVPPLVAAVVEEIITEGVKIINNGATGPHDTTAKTLGDILTSGVVVDTANSQFNVSMTAIAHNLSSLLSPLIAANNTITDSITTKINTTLISSNPFQGLQAYADLNWCVWLTIIVVMPLVGIIITITVNQQDDKAYRRYLQFLRLEFDTRLGMHSPR